MQKKIRNSFILGDFFKRCFLVLFVFISLIFSANATDVDITAYVYKDSTIFNYKFSFDEGDSINKFSIEKPKDAIIAHATDSNGNVEYEEAGDYFIFHPENTEDEIILIRIKSSSISNQIIETETFRNYQNFNLPATTLKYNLIFKDDFGDIIDIFPENYNLAPNNEINWEISNVTKDLVFVVNFKERAPEQKVFTINYYYILIIIIPFIVFFLYLFYQRYFKNSNNKKRKKDAKKSKEDKKEDLIVKIDEETNEDKKIEEVKTKSESESQEHKESFEEFIEKHLTENEKEIVKLIKDNEGIPQFDILNHLPQLTKSNLSKIISKLHSRRILKRIKVGKVNNIYLGDKISKSEVDKKEEEQN